MPHNGNCQAIGDVIITLGEIVRNASKSAIVENCVGDRLTRLKGRVHQLNSDPSGQEPAQTRI